MWVVEKDGIRLGIKAVLFQPAYEIAKTATHATILSELQTDQLVPLQLNQLANYCTFYSHCELNF